MTDPAKMYADVMHNMRALNNLQTHLALEISKHAIGSQERLDLIDVLKSASYDLRIHRMQAEDCKKRIIAELVNPRGTSPRASRPVTFDDIDQILSGDEDDQEELESKARAKRRKEAAETAYRTAGVRQLSFMRKH